MTGPAITTFGPHQTLFPSLGTSLYGNLRTVENLRPRTQFSPIIVPGISTVAIPLQTKYEPFPISVSPVILLLYIKKISNWMALGNKGTFHRYENRIKRYNLIAFITLIDTNVHYLSHLCVFKYWFI